MMNIETKKRLIEEAKYLKHKVNKLQDFTRTENFFKLTRANKSMIYKQLRYMLQYLEVLGERIEFNIPEADWGDLNG